MAQHIVTMIPGEGTGPEICEAVRMVFNASGVDIKWEYEEIGLDCLEKHGTFVRCRRKVCSRNRILPA